MKTKRYQKPNVARKVNHRFLLLAAKVQEEAAEITKEVTKAPFRKNGLNKAALLEEIEHTERALAILRYVVTESN